MRKVILVMGGGGMKGLAHVGAIRALEEAGVRPAELVGTSIGALVGAVAAAGASWGDLVRRATGIRKQDIVTINRWVLLFNGIRQRSVFRGDTFQDFIREQLPVERFEDLAIPLGVNAVDLETGAMEWFGAGGRLDVPLADAVYASCALPLFYPPALIDGKHYVDGGVRAALAVERARERGADLIVAVDVAAGPEKDALDTVGRGLVAIHHRVFDIMTHARRRRVLEEWDGPPLLYVRPSLDGYSTFDFTATDYFLEEGHRATREVLAEAGMAPPLAVPPGPLPPPAAQEA